jgi:hypothetical protein
MALDQNFLDELPFYDLNTEDFLRTTGAWLGIFFKSPS